MPPKTRSGKAQEAADAAAPAATAPAPNFILTPGSPSFYVAMVVTSLAYTQKWLTKLGLFSLYPELTEEIAAPLLGLVTAVLTARIMAIIKERKEQKEQKEQRQVKGYNSE